ADGSVRWRRPLGPEHPWHVPLAIAWHDYVVVTAHYETPGDDYWWVWNSSGDLLTTGLSHWRARYAFRGDVSEINVVSDSAADALLIGSGIRADFLKAGRLVRAITDLPGVPQCLEAGIVVCNDGAALTAIKLE